MDKKQGQKFTSDKKDQIFFFFSNFTDKLGNNFESRKNVHGFLQEVFAFFILFKLCSSYFFPFQHLFLLMFVIFISNFTRTGGEIFFRITTRTLTIVGKWFCYLMFLKCALAWVTKFWCLARA